MPDRTITAIGIDLAASPRRDTGICIIRGKRASVSIAHDDGEILAIVRAVRGKKAIGMDAPLSLPPGRRSIDERGPFHFRPCDLELRKRGIRFFPITIGPMRALTRRGMALRKKLSLVRSVVAVREVYPGATLDIFNIPRKDGGRIARWAGRFVRLPGRRLTQDESDSVAAAITMSMHLSGKSAELGPEGGHCIVIPAPPGAAKPMKP